MAVVGESCGSSSSSSQVGKEKGAAQRQRGRVREHAPTSEAITLVQSIIEKVKDMPPLSRQERETLEDWVIQRDRKTNRISTSELELLARMSARQLNRLNKRKLRLEDRELLQAMEMLKRG